MSLTPNAVIIHGMPSEKEYYKPENPTPGNAHWFPWLKKQFILNNILAETPEMPTPYAPQYEEWREVFERYPITPETSLVGHSLGSGFIVRWLTEHPDVQVGNVVLVAPWLGEGSEDVAGFDPNFFNFVIDPNIASRARNLTIIYSTYDDEADLHGALKLEESLFNVQVLKYTDRGHFVGIAEFPDILSPLQLTTPEGV